MEKISAKGVFVHSNFRSNPVVPSVYWCLNGLPDSLSRFKER